MEGIVDNTFDMTDFLEELVCQREGFRLVPNYKSRQCTNLGFWYIPPRSVIVPIYGCDSLRIGFFQFEKSS